jgi:N,N-dimethylformamidase beta subunit-like protein
MEQTSVQNFGYNNTSNNYNRSRIQQQKNFFPHVFLKNMTATTATTNTTDFNTTSSARAMLNPNYDYGYSRSIKLNDTQPASATATSKTTTITPENYLNVSKEIGNRVRIALVEPTFTAAAYNNSFYVFYARYNGVTANMNVTSDLNLLSSKVSMHPTIIPTTQVHSAFAMLSLLKNLKLVSPDSNITVLTDADVDVNPNSNAYDVIILGHQEYVTQQEYNYLRNFVANGGSMILLDGNAFYAQVIPHRIGIHRLQKIRGFLLTSPRHLPNLDY